MRMIQDYRDDLEPLLAAWRAREPFAFTRFGDGEAFILAANPGFHVDLPTENWRADEVDDVFRERLLAALSYDAEGYYVGLFARRKAGERFKWYARYIHEPVRAPRERRTFAEIWSYRNWGRFTVDDCRGAVLVCSRHDPAIEDVDVLLVPKNDAWTLDPKDTVEALQEKKKPVIVAAGPWSNVLIHEYWRTTAPEDRQPIINIGSALDPQIHGRTTRNYHTHIPRVLEFVWPAGGELS